MSAPKCEACGAAFVLDPDYGIPWMCEQQWERTCQCTDCPRCGEVFPANDPHGPQIAASDELAEEHDPSDQGACGACWAAKLETRKWSHVACGSRIVGAVAGTSYPCTRRRGHGGHHAAGDVHWNDGKKKRRA